MADLINLIKQAAVEAVRADDPTEVLFGVVTGVNPLEVNIDQKMTLQAPMLILTNNVRDYTVEVDVIWSTRSSGDPAHSHPVSGRKIMTVHNGLKLGEKVLLIKMQGGQKYIVLDRVVDR